MYFRNFSFHKDGKKQVTHLYFTKYIYETKLKANSKILIIDYIYKSNKYCLLLFNIVKITYLNIAFYMIFRFFLEGWIENFI